MCDSFAILSVYIILLLGLDENIYLKSKEVYFWLCCYETLQMLLQRIHWKKIQVTKFAPNFVRYNEKIRNLITYVVLSISLFPRSESFEKKTRLWQAERQIHMWSNNGFICLLFKYRTRKKNNTKLNFIFNAFP